MSIVVSPNSYDCTGILVLDNATRVIKALFGRFIPPEPTYRGPSITSPMSKHFVEIEYRHVLDSKWFDDDITWDDVYDNLMDVALETGVSLDGPSFRELLRALVARFNAEKLEGIEEWLEDDNAYPTFDKLFVLATLLDDGHGLSALFMEGSWLKNGYGGGDGLFISSAYCAASSSVQALSLGAAAHFALLDADVEQAAIQFALAVETQIAGVRRTDLRNQIRSRIASILATPPESVPDGTPQAGPILVELNVARRAEAFLLKRQRR